MLSQLPTLVLQVIATAVSHAAALSPTNTSIEEIGRNLKLDPRMIRKCQTRFDSLTDGEYEELFDDRQAVRSDTLPEAWLDFVRQYWTDPYLADADGKAYNFVRRSESQSDEMRDPKDRKSTERYRLHWRVWATCTTLASKTAGCPSGSARGFTSVGPNSLTKGLST